MKHWLVKQEPAKYAWRQFVADGQTDWTGVRNYQARNFLREMSVGDLVLYYHSVEDKAVVGIAKVTREAFPDPTAREGDWSAVELRPVRALAQTVPLTVLRAEKGLEQMAFLRQSRLSVSPVAEAEYARIVQLAHGFSG